MKFIAEIGWNFVGDMNLAENMIFLRKSLALIMQSSKFGIHNT